MTTTAAGSIRFGGSGFGPEYIHRRKRQVQARDDGNQSAGAGQDLLRRHKDDEFEVFLFTVKDPIRSALVQLMALLKYSMLENPAAGSALPEVVSGPLGYTSVRAVRPINFVPTKSVFKPVMR